MPENDFLSLEELINNDNSSYEFFYSLSGDVRRKLLQKSDISSFEQLQNCAGRIMKRSEKQKNFYWICRQYEFLIGNQNKVREKNHRGKC